MKLRPERVGRKWPLTAAVVFAAMTSSCMSLTPPRDMDDTEGCAECKDKAKVCKDPTMHALACDLDALEEHIDKFGSVVAKQPDVWGQARMQQHRWDFEQQMKGELKNFSPTLQGSLSRSDQAYFADAAMLSYAASTTGGGAPSTANANANANQAGTPATGDTFGAFGQIGRSLPLPALQPSFAAAVGATATTAATGSAAAGAVVNISLEPTEKLDQEARYLNYLNELRRINEGDDTADAPGYSLNVVRVPVSLLPGKHTRIGHGAEVTMTLTPYLSDELLPTTFRNLVANDLVDQIGLPLTQALNDCDVRCALQAMDPLDPDNPCEHQPKCSRCDPSSSPPPMPQAGGAAPLIDDSNSRKMVAFSNDLQKDPKKRALFVKAVTNHHYFVPATKDRRAQLPFPPSQMDEVYGTDFMINVALEAYGTFKNDLIANPVIQFPDVQGYLQEELGAARKLLADPHNAALWDFCTPDLATMVHTHQVDHLTVMRTNFQTVLLQTDHTDDHHQTHIALAWAIIVESALLNEHLVQDMKESASLKGCACLPTGWLPYYLPEPPEEARKAFNDYVRCRWPIHVFALDPFNQEQNIADQYSRRREMQLSLSLAFVRGEISASNMSRYARRLEADMDTIDLNRTQVGFSHGDDTFGWRFYPRFQSPDVESNTTVFFRDLLIGGPNRDQDLAQRRLEPGERECTAVVIMPSFMPYATLEVSSNWFRLTDPKCKELTAAQAVRLGRAVKSIQNCGPQVRDADCYRDGDLGRLLRKAQQLEDRLPLQSMTVQVPYENTLGGFAMFSTGVTDLAPDLTGWYGTPSIDPKNDTTLFLVGRHFSVLGTRVVAGGVEVPAASMELLSREVIKVTIPKGSIPYCGNGHYPESVDVHLATPYGVTSHLMIPTGAAPTPAPPTVGMSWGTDGQVDLGYIYSGVGIASSSGPNFRPPTIMVTTTDTSLANVPAQITLVLPNKDKITLPTPVTFASGKATVSGADLVAAAFAEYGTAFGEQRTPPASVPIQQVSVQPLQPLDAKNQPPAPVPLSSNLTINWVFAPK